MTKAAFEVRKGPQEVLSLSAADVEQYLDPGDLLREMEMSFGALAREEVQCPPRPEITIPGKGFSLAMVDSPRMSTKSARTLRASLQVRDQIKSRNLLC
jgi:hypothetical protein